MKKFVGNLSDADAELIERYAARADAILEFGVGGSTQIIAQSAPPDARFVSVDTDARWIADTRDRLAKLGVADRCMMKRWESWIGQGERASYDLVFVDGQRDLRLPFALRAWTSLRTGGAMLFHDTRRHQDFNDVLTVLLAHYEEVECVMFNERFEGRSSNVTAVVKKEREPYVDWTAHEGKPPWRYALAPVPEDFWSAT